MASFHRRKTRLIQPRGFYFARQHMFSSSETADHVIKALVGADLSGLSVPQARSRAVEKLNALFTSCLDKQILFRAIRDSSLFWETISQDFTGYFVLDAEEVRETVGTYAQARHLFDSNAAPTALNSRVDQWIQVVQQTNSQPPPSTFNLAWRPGANGVVMELAEAMGAMSLGQSATLTDTWPPTHFTAEEVLLLTSTAEFRQELYGITSSNHGLPHALPTDLTKPMDVRKFLCWTALVGTTATSTKSLYSTPVAYIDRSMRQDWYRATGNMAMICTSFDRFLSYAADALTTRGKASVTCLFTPWMLGISHASYIHDNDGDQLWSHPRMTRYGTAITIRLLQQTQQGITQTALEIIRFDAWRKYRPHLRSKFGGHQVKMMQLNSEVKAKIEQWAAGLGNGMPIIGWWWGGIRMGGSEDDAVSMAAAFCLEFMRDRDLPNDEQQLQALGFVKADEH